MLQVGEYRGVDFDQLLDAVIGHNRGIDKEHRIPERILCALLTILSQLWTAGSSASCAEVQARRRSGFA